MKNLLFLLILLPAFYGSAQTEDCFQRANRQKTEDLKNPPNIRIGDTVPQDFISKGQQRLQSLIGCQFPDSPFITVQGKEISTGKIQSDFVIVYMSMFYCDVCNAMLEEFAKLKKEYGSKLIIMAIMEDNHSDFKHLMSAYEDKIIFVQDSREWIFSHNAGCGVPITFLLDKSRLIKFIKNGAAPDNSQLMNELKKRMK
jgi:cytochrome oxidase Cu insertion factor (SCO1/SenC/PrrC family)